MAKLKESESKLQQQVEEFTRRENVLKMRLATKQQELQELMVSQSFSQFLENHDDNHIFSFPYICTHNTSSYVHMHAHICA